MDELETLLRQFRPRRPRPLPDVGRARAAHPAVWVALSGIAAAVVIMVGWRSQTAVPDTPQIAVTLGDLAYALDEAGDLDAILTRTSRALLPDVERSNGVLHALAKE
jgi:hypothetical protein